jgi:glyoxylase-like metal-dependent hydrolase (beta-lactamase superfamily II)
MKKYLSLLLFLFSTNLFAQSTIEEHKKNSAAIKDSLIKVSDNVHIILPLGVATNILVYESEDGLIIVDAQFEELEPTITKLLNSISDKPVLYVFNTHFHFDHVDGNKAFGKKGVKIIGHDNLRKRLLTDQVIGGRLIQKAYPYDALPYITFSDSLTIHEKDEEIKIFYVKNAHTDTDAFIEFKNENIFHTGDVFVRYGFPFIDENNGGNIFGIIKSVDDLISRIDNTTKIIPGHGPISYKKDLILYRNNLQLIVNRIREGILNNLSVEQVIQNDPLKDINWNVDIDWNTGFSDTSLKAGQNISKVYKMIKEYMNLELKK